LQDIGQGEISHTAYDVKNENDMANEAVLTTATKRVVKRTPE
jgi:hypothetical protein